MRPFKYSIAAAISIASCGMALAQQPTDAQVKAEAAKQAAAANAQLIAGHLPPEWLAIVVIVIVLGVALYGLKAIAGVLGDSNSKWSLADALSEDVELSDPTDATKKFTKLVASSSRLIALLGSIAILALYIGFAIVVLWFYARAGVIPDSTGSVIQFLLSGLALFAPYVVNKFSSLFDVKLSAR
jgi:uncharacterized membrane protein (DUF485 family)